jgi:hypothetical protein
VRGRALPYCRSAKRCALSQSNPQATHSRLAHSTNPKSLRSSSFLPSSIAGTGRHMATEPCSPSAFLSEVESSNFFTLSPTPLPVHERRLCIRPQEAFSCISLPLILLRRSKMPQSGAIAPAIAFAIASAIHIDSLRQSHDSGEVHQGGEAAVSCRLCLTACNLRQFDEAATGEASLDAR